MCLCSFAENDQERCRCILFGLQSPFDGKGRDRGALGESKANHSYLSFPVKERFGSAAAMLHGGPLVFAHY